MVSIDIYLNETTRYANVILPPPPVLARSHYDLALYQLAVHNVAHYSPPVIEREPGALDEWELFLRLAAILAGQGSDADPQSLDELVITTLIQRDVAELLEDLKPRRGPERMLDFLLRSGPYGDAFGSQDGINMETLEAQPHGVDLGPLQPRIPEVLRTPSGKIELAPQLIVEGVERLRTSFEQSLARDNGHMYLIGRRDLRSNNSWMHNLHVLTKGKERCTLHMHPEDATRLGLADGNVASVASRAGSIEIPIEITDAIMPGVVSIPHGWGHSLSRTKTRIAAEHAGVNTNRVADEGEVDPLSGNAVLNGCGKGVDLSLLTRGESTIGRGYHNRARLAQSGTDKHNRAGASPAPTIHGFGKPISRLEVAGFKRRITAICSN